MPIDRSESIARAVCSDKWDANTGRISPSLFKGQNVSVSRLKICPLDQSWDLFRRHVAKPPERRLERLGTIKVETLHDIGLNYTAGPVPLEVEADPLVDFPSHAIITGKISRGLATSILKAVSVYSEF